MTGPAARVAVTCWLVGAVVVIVTWWDAGNQVSSATQLPAVLVGLGGGFGLVVLGAALWTLDRTRARGRRAEVALAEVVRRAERRITAGVA
jgi:hypothetical protein